MTAEYDLLESNHSLILVIFIINITQHPNILNRMLQGKDLVHELKAKLFLILVNLARNNIHQFLRL